MRMVAALGRTDEGRGGVVLTCVARRNGQHREHKATAALVKLAYHGPR